MGDLDWRNLGALLGLIVHDLRNPLSALHSNVGFLDILLRGADAETREVLADFGVSCTSLGHIIENLEFVSLLVSDPTAAPERAAVPLSAIVSEAVMRTEAIVESYGARVPRPAASKAEPNVLVHRDLAIRALGNLIVNAAQHGRKNGAISVSVEARSGNGLIVVADQGDPLPSELLESVFTAGGQLASKRNPNGRYSRGVGLYAAALAAEMAGARVRALAPEGGGSAFELSAPLC